MQRPDPNDRFLGEAAGRFGWRIFAWGLMSNHFHLLLETPGANLCAGMKWMQGTYATRFGVRRRTVGSIFAGRYKALLIENDGRRLRTVIEYIHRNAWRAAQAHLQAGLEAWPWSSLRFFMMSPGRRPAWLAVADALRWNDVSDTARGRQQYLEDLEARARLGTRRSDQERSERLAWRQALKRGWYFGSEAFKEERHARAAAILGKEPGLSPIGVA
jgi:REP-associated tyrosine transposase